MVLSLNWKNTSEKNKVSQDGYELVNNWPELSKGYKIGQPTGIGIDKGSPICFS